MQNFGAIVVLGFLIVYGFWAVSFTKELDKDFAQSVQRLATEGGK